MVALCSDWAYFVVKRTNTSLMTTQLRVLLVHMCQTTQHQISSFLVVRVRFRVDLGTS